MKRSYYTLEVVCHKENEKDKRLLKDGSLSKITRPFLGNEGPNSRNEGNKVDLFKLDKISDLVIPSDIDSFSLVLFKKTNYTSNQCCLITVEGMNELLRVGDNLFAYASECEALMVLKEYYQEVLVRYAYYIKKYIKKLKLERLKELKRINEVEIKQTDEIIESLDSLKLIPKMETYI